MGIDARTPVPTATGWKPARMLVPGDTVYSYDGSPAKVVSVQEYEAQECYKAWTQGGLTLIMDWRTGIPVLTAKQMESHRRWTRKRPKMSPLVIQPVGPRLAISDPEPRWLINCSPLKMPTRELPVEPYYLGRWMLERSAKRKRSQYAITRSLIERYPTIPDYIPDEYLFASFEQRLDLLRGIVSTRPTPYKKKESIFVLRLKDYRTFRQLQGLIESLGIRVMCPSRPNQRDFELRFRTVLRLVPEQPVEKSTIRFEFRKITKIESTTPRTCVFVQTTAPDNTMVVSEGFMCVSL
jgi:hypothetical protein